MNRLTHEQRVLVRAGGEVLDRYRCAECDEYRWQRPVGDFPTCAAGHEMRFDGRLGDGKFGWPARGLARREAWRCSRCSSDLHQVWHEGPCPGGPA